MKKTFKNYFAVAIVIIGLGFFSAPVFGEEGALTPQQEAVLADIASAFSDPPQVEMQSTLIAPVTHYEVQFLPTELERLDALRKKATDVGMAMNTWIDVARNDWKSEITCGTFYAYGNASKWEHPNGKSKGDCPHQEGASHVGTISVNSVMRFSLGVINSNIPRLEGVWDVKCSFVGSENGRSDCDEKLSIWGKDDKRILSSEYHGTPEQRLRAFGDRWMYIGVVIVIGGVAYYFYRRRE